MRTWIRGALLVAGLLSSASAFACPFCGGGRRGEPVASDYGGTETGNGNDGSRDVPRTMIVAVRDNVKGEEVKIFAEELESKVETPHGFSCNLTRKKSTSADIGPAYEIVCQKDGQVAGTVAHACGQEPSEKRWDAQGKNGLAIVSVFLRCI